MSQIPHKSLQKMCKSPKNSSYSTIKQEKIDYENLSTNCTVVGSNNLNLVKKPQIVTSMSPAYSNSSPGYPPSPYSSPASMKSPSPSLKPPTPQPNFPVMQIIHNNILARPIQTSQPQNIIKLKPHLNILPKPSASPQSSPKPSVSPQIVIPTNHQPTAAAAATIMPTAQPLLLNQMPMLTAPAGVQFILRPQTTKIQPQVQATPQGLILQSAGGGQQLLQIHQPQAVTRSQPMVRVLTNGMHLTPTSTTTYVTQVGGQQPINATHIAQQQTIVNNTQQHQVIQQQVKKKPKHKMKKKLDLANIMKLSGIGDEDDIQFESDTSQSESEPASVPTTPQPQQVVQSSTVQAQSNYVHTDAKKNIQNIQISAVAQPTINTATPVVQVLNQNFQSGMISNSTSQAATAQASIPFNSFITPNFTINNGLMLQRSGGFKLTVGDDGRLVLQHDPTLNQDLQSQLILQSLLGLNGGLVLHPSMDQQTVQQTVQTIQQQSVQTIQQQTVQSQTIQTVQQQTVQPQTVQHTIQSLQPQIQQQTVQQTIQHQTVNALQQPMQIVQPQPIASIHSQAQPMHSISQSQVHSLQSQIQSLLQQQNQAVQAQTVQHSHVQPQSIHSQALQNVQNLQNIQNLQQNVQGMQQSVQQNLPQTVQQNVQNLQQNVQHVHPQSIQSPVHSVQNFSTQTHSQTQPVLKVQPFQKSQPPVQTVQPIQHHNVNHQQHQQQEQQPQQQQPHDNPQNQSQNNPTPPASYVVNLTPDQLEQLKRNGQLTVNGQTIFMQRPNKDQHDKKMSPKSKPIKKVNKIQGIKGILQESVVNDSVKPSNNTEQVKESIVKPLVSALNAPSKHILPQNYVQPQPIQNKPIQQQAMVQPQPLGPQVHAKTSERPKAVALSPQLPKQQKVSPTLSSVQSQDSNGSNTNPDVDKLLGQILEESTGSLTNSNRSTLASSAPSQQRITTIQLTPQKQQHLKSIQVQIQTLSARLTPGDTEMQNALKMLFSEQQKILASGKLLPPDKVYYHNNQLTIVNPSSLNLSPPISTVKNEPPLSPDVNQPIGCQNVSKNSSNTKAESLTSHQPSSTQVPHAITRLAISTPTSENTVTQTIHHHPHPIPNSHTHCHLQPHSPIIHRHSPIPNQVPGHLISNHQIPCHQTNTIHHQPHSNQVGQVSHSTTASHSTQVGHSTQINHAIPVGHAAQVGHATQIGLGAQAGGSSVQITLASQSCHNAQVCHPSQLNHSPQVGHVAQVTQAASVCHSTQVCHLAQSSHTTQVSHTPQVGHSVPPGSHPVQMGSQSHLSPGNISVGSKIGTPQQLSPVSVINMQHQNLQQHSSQITQQLQQHSLPSQHIPPHQQQQIQHQHLQQQELLVQQQQKQEQQQFLSLAKKSHLIETHLNLDQNGAIRPDIHTPFRDKKDACIRLVRYHSLEQPVLSQKDLDKADEIFELTARHFMGKYNKMVDKYKYLLMKESMREVQTSELMMLDRLFLAEEQQSLIRLRQDCDNQILNIPIPNPEHLPGNCTKQSSQLQQQVHQPSTSQNTSSHIVVAGVKCTESTPEDYDEWACIQRELGCLPQSVANATTINKISQGNNTSNQQQVSLTAVNTQNLHNSKRSASSDSRLETLKRFRVDKHHKKSMDYHISCNSGGVQNNSAISSVPSTVSNNQSSKSSNSYDITQNSNYSSHEDNEPENNSIDEQVQSAIDSILNLQQNTNTPLDLDSILS